MRMHNRVQVFCFLFIGCASLALTACSSLKIKVSVYDGPMLDPWEGRIAAAYGLAGAIQTVADDLVCPDGKAATRVQRCAKDHKILLEGLEKNYVDLGIAKRYEKYCTARDGDKKTVEETKLLSALIAYSDYTQVIAQRIGTLELRKSMTPLDWFLPPLILPFNIEYITALVALDESARIMKDLANSVIAEREGEKSDNDDNDVFLSRIHYVMSSQAPGTLMTLIRNNPTLFGQLFSNKYIRKIYDERYWKTINPVEVSAVGDAFVMLVKDDIGNWQLKAVKTDPTKVIDASYEVVRAIIKAYTASQGL